MQWTLLETTSRLDEKLSLFIIDCMLSWPLRVWNTLIKQLTDIARLEGSSQKTSHPSMCSLNGIAMKTKHKWRQERARIEIKLSPGVMLAYLSQFIVPSQLCCHPWPLLTTESSNWLWPGWKKTGTAPSGTKGHSRCSSVHSAIVQGK